MSKIRIKENDRTGTVQSSPISNVVFMPLVGGQSSHSEIKLFKSAKELTESISEGGWLLARGVSGTELDFRICKHLLNIGFEVLVGVLEEGDSLNEVAEALKDRSLYDVRFLTAGKITIGVSNLAECAEERGDCIALLNLPEAEDVGTPVSEIRGTFEPLCSGSVGQYCAAFTPWFWSKHPDLVENEREPEPEEIPAAYGYLFAYANSIKNNPEWYAVAGFERGIIPELSGLCRKYSSAEIEILQGRGKNGEVDLDAPEDNVGIAINPIADIRPAGPIIYGNRTLKDNDSNKKTTATSFLNVRNLVSAVKKVMYDAARKYTFEQNNEVLWLNFQAYITPLLDKMQSGNGILGYKFIRQRTNAKARLAAKLKIIPIEAVEDFDLEIVLTDDLDVNE